MAIKYDRTKFLRAVSGAFSEIHQKDRKVTRVAMPHECFVDIVTSRDSLISLLSDQVGPEPLRRNHRANLGRITHGQEIIEVESLEEHPVNIGKLWGANIYFSDKLEIISDDYRYVPGSRGTYPGIEAVSPSIRIEVPFSYKLFTTSNLVIHIKSRARPFRDMTDSEVTAVSTLREMITEADYRKYIKYGFILVKSPQGDVYQIFRERFDHIKVWRDGKVVKEVCVRIKDGKIPPTDNVIAFKTIIETNPGEFEKMGNVYNMEAA